MAGVLSGLLGIGGGVFKVPAINLLCGVPIKAAAATSNFMIGVTAAASAFLYLGRGDVQPAMTAAVVLGIVLGSGVGSFLNRYVGGLFVKRLFAVLLVGVAVQLLVRAWMGERRGTRMNDAESRSRRWVQRTLTVGLVASAVLLIAGTVLVFARQEGAQTSSSVQARGDRLACRSRRRNGRDDDWAVDPDADAGRAGDRARCGLAARGRAAVRGSGGDGVGLLAISVVLGTG